MPTAPDAVRPGSHSRNARRSAFRETNRQDTHLLRWAKQLLLAAGLVCIGYYFYALGDQYVYQKYENWAFDQEISGRKAVTFIDYVREAIPDIFWPSARPISVTAPPSSQPASTDVTPHLVEGDLVARVSVRRLELSAMVREGVSAKTLSTSVGHIPLTALPGAIGNFAIAAHRDTLFRALKNIRLGDQVTVESHSQRYVYEVVATKIVRPSDVTVLRADGGGLYTAAAGNDSRPERLLTMITCYPFYYVGSAPKRFIVESRLVSRSPLS
jgi:sortase A